jgi:hypothetical protein
MRNQKNALGKQSTYVYDFPSTSEHISPLLFQMRRISSRRQRIYLFDSLFLHHHNHLEFTDYLSMSVPASELHVSSLKSQVSSSGLF